MMPTIIQLKGGLGNQLFQFTFGRFLEIKYKHKIVYDARGIYNSLSSRNLELTNFSLWTKYKDNFLIENKKRYFKDFYGYYYLYRLLNMTHFDINIKNILKYKFSHGIYKGYWQNKYFISEIFLDIIPELDLKLNSNYKYPMIDDSSYETVGIHIRGSDYLNQSNLINLSKEYYKNAIKYIKSKLSNPVFIIFTDDIIYAKTIINPNNCIFFESQNTILDFMYLSKCKNQIIANSTYSWWASTLNKNEKKIVISPKEWFYKHDVDLKLKFMIEL